MEKSAKPDSTKDQKICDNCHAKINGEVFQLAREGKKFNACRSCYDKIISTADKEKTDINYFSAAALGLAGGFIGSLLWFGIVILTKYQLGIVAIAVGYLVGLGVVYGAGKKKSKHLQFISCVIALLAILFGEYLINNYFAHQYLAQEGYEATSYFLNPIAIMEIVFSSLKEDFLTIVFWAIAVYSAYFVAKPVKIVKLGSSKN